MKTGFVSESIKMLCSTSLLEAGVSIKNAVKLLFLADCKCAQKAIQIINRPRINSEKGINTTLDVALFRSQYSENNIKKQKFVSAGTYFDKAKNTCKGLNRNGFGKGEKSMKLPSDMNFAYWYHSNEYKVNPLGILHEMYRAENNCNLQMMLKRIARFDDRINVQDPQYVTNAEIEQVKEIRANLLENEKFNKEYLDRLLLDDSTRYDTIRTIIFMSKDMELKKNSQLTHKIQILDIDECKKFIDEHKQAFAGTGASKILKNINFLMNSGIEQKRLVKNPESLNAKDLFNADINSEIITRIAESNRKKRRNSEYPWTADDFKKITNKCRKKLSENSNFKPVTNGTALSLVRTFFQVASKTKKIDGKNTRFYKIVKKVKAKNVVEKLSKKG